MCPCGVCVGVAHRASETDVDAAVHEGGGGAPPGLRGELAAAVPELFVIASRAGLLGHIIGLPSDISE